MTLGSLLVRLGVAVGLIVAVFLLERMGPGLLSGGRRRRKRREDVPDEEGEEPRATSPDAMVLRMSRLKGVSSGQSRRYVRPNRKDPAPASEPVGAPAKALAKARAARMAKKSALRVLDQKKESVHREKVDSLAKLREEAATGSDETLHKLSKAALEKGYYIEAYYWKLKVEMARGRLFGLIPYDIQRQWVKKGCPSQHSHVVKDFSEAQGMFARAVLRLRSGKDVAKAMKRLRKLEQEGNEDARRYLHYSRKTDAGRKDPGKDAGTVP